MQRHFLQHWLYVHHQTEKHLQWLTENCSSNDFGINPEQLLLIYLYKTRKLSFLWHLQVENRLCKNLPNLISLTVHNKWFCSLLFLENVLRINKLLISRNYEGGFKPCSTTEYIKIQITQMLSMLVKSLSDSMSSSFPNSSLCQRHTGLYRIRSIWDLFYFKVC